MHLPDVSFSTFLKLVLGSIRILLFLDYLGFLRVRNPVWASIVSVSLKTGFALRSTDFRVISERLWALET